MTLMTYFYTVDSIYTRITEVLEKSKVLTILAFGPFLLLAIVERLTYHPVAVAPELNYTMACNEVPNIFPENILTVKGSIFKSVPNPLSLPIPLNTNIEKMAAFQRLIPPPKKKEKECNYMVNQLSFFCCLNVLPTHFLKVLPLLSQI